MRVANARQNARQMRVTVVIILLTFNEGQEGNIVIATWMEYSLRVYVWRFMMVSIMS